MKNVRITQGFGENAIPLYKDLGMRGHNAADMVARDGTPAFSVLNGICAYTDTSDKSYGYFLFLRTPTKQINGVQCFVEVVYAHLQEIFVKTGEEVTEGQLIAHCDNTGFPKFSTGSHLHLGTRVVYIIKGQEKRMLDNGYFGYSDPALFLTSGRESVYPVDQRYGRPRNYFAEKVFAFSLVTRRALGRLPTPREINAITYGNGWTLPHIVNPALFVTWSEMTYDEYREKLRAMIGS
ncbi:MAG: M23 family metallopeptidase [Candidatus Eisenbacteria bacterium]|nr:M23 family metallopeptidase [Candidatus Eisenbacteria bacterium]